MKKKILLIDDDKRFKKQIIEFFDEYEFRHTGDEKEFWSILEKDKWIPDIFIIDWILVPPNKYATNLINKLTSKFPDIPRIVLTSGKGKKGSANRIASQSCHYVYKAFGFDEVKEKIELYTKRKKTTLLSSDEYKKEIISALEKRKKQLETGLEVSTKENSKITKKIKAKEKELQQLDIAKSKIETEKSELIKTNTLLINFNYEVNKTISDDKSTSQDCYIKLVKFYVKHFSCQHGALILYDEEKKLCIKETEKDNIRKYEIVSLRQKNIGNLYKTESILAKILNSDDRDDEENVCQIINSVKSYPALVLKANIDLEDCDNLMILSIVKDGKIKGRMLLYRKENAFNEKDEINAKQLSLSAVIENIKDSVFRIYEKQGIIDGLLKFISLPIALIFYIPLKLLSLVLKLFKLNWSYEFHDLRDKKFLMSSFMGFLRLSIIILSLLIVILPIIKFCRSNFQWEPLNIIHYIESILMYFTFILFSLGLLVLAEPKYAIGLPNWMRQFSHISTLKRTLLTLIVILIAISVLGDYLNVADPISEKTILHLFFRTIGAFFIIISIGIFIKLNLFEDKEK